MYILTLYDYLIEIKGYEPQLAKDVIEAYTNGELLATEIQEDINDYKTAEDQL